MKPDIRGRSFTPLYVGVEERVFTMCMKSPGPRCVSSARKALVSAREKWLENKEDTVLTAAYEKTIRAYDATPEGIERCLSKGMLGRAVVGQQTRTQQMIDLYAEDKEAISKHRVNQEIEKSNILLAELKEQEAFGEPFTPTLLDDGELDTPAEPVATDTPECVPIEETVFTKRYADHDARMEAFKTELTNGYSNLQDLEAYYSLLNAVSKFHTYSPMNQMLINLQNPNAVKVASFKKWKEEYGRTVKKGERAIGIFAPSSKPTILRDDKGKPILDDKGKQQKTWKSSGKPRFVLVSVFGDDQTEGEPLPTGSSLSETPPAGFTDDLHAAITAEGFTVSYEDTGFTGGYTTSNGNKVVVNSSLSPAQRARTLAHELGHIKAGHLARTDEYHSAEGGCRGEMEMEAESISYAICRSNGMSSELSSTSSRYIKGWNTHNPEATVEKTMKTISSTVKTILGSGLWKNLES